MNIPHIEVRSKPFENPREALDEDGGASSARRSARPSRSTCTRASPTPCTAGARARRSTEWMRRTSRGRCGCGGPTTAPSPTSCSRRWTTSRSTSSELNKALKAFSRREPLAAEGHHRAARDPGLTPEQRDGTGKPRHRVPRSDEGHQAAQELHRLTAEAFGGDGTAAGPGSFDKSRPTPSRTTRARATRSSSAPSA